MSKSKRHGKKHRPYKTNPSFLELRNEAWRSGEILIPQPLMTIMQRCRDSAVAGVLFELMFKTLGPERIPEWVELSDEEAGQLNLVGTPGEARRAFERLESSKLIASRNVDGVQGYQLQPAAFAPFLESIGEGTWK